MLNTPNNVLISICSNIIHLEAGAEVFFVCFLGDLQPRKIASEINWPLALIFAQL